jgi:hypothetical protein
MGNIQTKKNLKKLNNPQNCVAYDNQYGYNLCDQPYALCTSAKCIKSPQDPNTAICSCSVENGCSMGLEDCSALQPFSSNGVDYIYSTYNPSQFFEKNMNLYEYSDNSQFANCLDQICTIDPLDSNNAICQCQLSTNSSWVALDSKYNTNPNIYLSGAPYDTYQDARNFFIPFGIKIPKKPINA